PVHRGGTQSHHTRPGAPVDSPLLTPLACPPTTQEALAATGATLALWRSRRRLARVQTIEAQMKLAGVPPPVGVAVPARGADGMSAQEVAPTPEAARRRRRPARSH